MHGVKLIMAAANIQTPEIAPNHSFRPIMSSLAYTDWDSN